MALDLLRFRQDRDQFATVELSSVPVDPVGTYDAKCAQQGIEIEISIVGTRCKTEQQE